MFSGRFYDISTCVCVRGGGHSISKSVFYHQSGSKNYSGWGISLAVNIAWERASAWE